MRRLICPFLLVVVLAFGASPSPAAPSPAALVDGAGCPIRLDRQASPPRMSGGCSPESGIVAEVVRDDTLLVDSVVSMQTYVRPGAGEPFARATATPSCLADRAGCFTPRSGQRALNHASLGDGTVYAASRAGLDVLRIAEDGSIAQPTTAGGCASWVGTAGCAALRSPPSAAPFVPVVVAATDAVYLLWRGTTPRIDVLRVVPDGLEPLIGAGSCASTSGTDGLGDAAACVALPRPLTIESVAVAGRYLIVSGTVVDSARCGGICAELLVLDRAPGTGALSAGALRCAGPATGCLAPRALPPHRWNVATSDDGTSVIGVGSSGANIFRIAADGSLSQSAGPEGCLTPGGQAGCLRLGTGAVDTLAFGTTLAIADGNAVVLLDRDPATGALARREGVDGCLGPAAPCHVVGSVPSYPGSLALLPDGSGAIRVSSFRGQSLGAVAIFPQRPPTCTPTVLEAWNGGVATGQPCTDPNGDRVALTFAPRPRGVAAAANGSLTWTAPNDQVGVVATTVTAADQPGRTASGPLSLRAIAPPTPRLTAVPGAQLLGRRRGITAYGVFYLQDISLRGAFIDGRGKTRAGEAEVRAPGAFAVVVRSGERLGFRIKLRDERSRPTRSGRVSGTLTGFPGGFRESSTLILLSPAPAWQSFYQIVGDEFWLRGQLLPRAAAREGTMRSERLAGRRWRRLAPMPITSAGRYILKTPGPGTYRIVWTPKRGRTRFNGFTWTMRLLPPRGPVGPRRSAAPTVIDRGGAPLRPA